MKKLSFLFFVTACCFIAGAQTALTVTPGTDFYISTGTGFSQAGLSLVPSAPFNLRGLSLTRSGTVTNPTANTSVLRSFLFSNATAPFSGTIRFDYLDAELNGLPEGNLQVNIHNGSSWQSVSSASNDAVNNYVLSISLTNRMLNEITLADVLHTLPLKWGNIRAYRQAQTIRIDWNTEQETNADYFSIERSVDGRTWQMVIDHLPATNTASPVAYSAVDAAYITSRLYYRIRLTDKDGKFSYAPVAAVDAGNAGSRVLIYPNPVRSRFYIGGTGANTIKAITLYNNAGAIVKTWAGVQQEYSIKTLPAALYYMDIELKSGIRQRNIINKQ